MAKIISSHSNLSCHVRKIIKLHYPSQNNLVKVFDRSHSINHSKAISSFPEELKLAEVMLTFKKGDSLDKENYSPIRLLSHTSKIYGQ